VLPINILIDLIFRKSRPKETRITNAFVGNVKPIRTLSQIRLKPRLIKCDDMTMKAVSDYDFVTEGNTSENDHSETDYTEIDHQKTDYTEIEHQKTDFIGCITVTDSNIDKIMDDNQFIDFSLPHSIL
jgi:hypothetical protein